MTMIGWFFMGVMTLAAFLVAALALWRADRLQQENFRLYEKWYRLQQEKDEENEYAHRAFRDFAPEDPATVLLFPDERRMG